MKTMTDIVSPKTVEHKNPDGTISKKTLWRRVGTAWRSQNQESESYNLELFMFPDALFVVNFTDKHPSGRQVIYPLDAIAEVNLKDGSNA